MRQVDVLEGQRLLVKYDAARLSASAIAGAVADAGMHAWLEHEEPIIGGDRTARLRWMLIGVSAATFAVGLALDMAGRAPLVARAAYAATVAAGATLTARRAWSAMRAWSLDINVLMMIAACGAVILDQWSEAAAGSGMAAEVSSAGCRKPVGEAYPAPALLSRFRKAGVPVTTASDAHGLPDVASHGAELRALLADAGYDSLVAFRARQPVPVEV